MQNLYVLVMINYHYYIFVINAMIHFVHNVYLNTLIIIKKFQNILKNNINK